MATRVISGLVVLLAVVAAFVPDLPEGIVPLLLVVLGLVHAAMSGEDASSLLVVAIAVGAAAGSGVLNNIPAIGGYLNSIVGSLSTALYAGVVTVLGMRVFNELKG